MTKRKKKLLILFIILGVWLTMFLTDVTISFFNGKPVFCIDTGYFYYKDGGSATYIGLLYNYNRIRSLRGGATYEINRDNGEDFRIYYYDKHSDFSVVTPWFFFAPSISKKTINNRYLEYDINIYKSLTFKKRMLKEYTLIDEYTTNNSKRYVKLLNGCETNDFITVYYDDAGNVTGYYKSHFLYSKSYDYGENHEIKADVNFDEVINVNDKAYTFDSITNTKDYYIGKPNDFRDYSVRYIKVYYLKYIDDDGNDIEIKKYYDSFEKKFYDSSKFKVDIEI